MNITESQFRELVRSEIISRNKGSLNEGLHSLVTQGYKLQWNGSLKDEGKRKAWAKNLGYEDSQISSIGTTNGNVAFEKWLRHTFPPGVGDNNATVKKAVNDPVEGGALAVTSGTATAGGTVADLIKMLQDTENQGTSVKAAELFTVLFDRIGQTDKLYIKVGGTETSLRSAAKVAGGGSYISAARKLTPADTISSLVSSPETVWAAVLYACLWAAKDLAPTGPELEATLNADKWEVIQAYLDGVNGLQPLKGIGMSFIIKDAETKKWGKDLEWKRATKGGADVFVATADVDIQALSGDKLKGAKPWTIKYYIGQGEVPSINIKSSDGDGKELATQGDSKSQFDYIVANIGTYAEVKKKVEEAEAGDDSGSAQTRDPDELGAGETEEVELVRYGVNYRGTDKVAFYVRLPKLYASAGENVGLKDTGDNSFLGLFDPEVLTKVNKMNLNIPDSQKSFVIRWGRYDGMPKTGSLWSNRRVNSIDNLAEISLDVQKFTKISREESEIRKVYDRLLSYKKQLDKQYNNYKNIDGRDGDFLKALTASQASVNKLIAHMKDSQWEELRVVRRDGIITRLYRPAPGSFGSSIFKQIDNVYDNMADYKKAKYKKGKISRKEMNQWISPADDSKVPLAPEAVEENITRNLLDTIESLILEELTKKKVVSEIYNRNLTTSTYRTPEPGRGVELTTAKGAIKKYGVLAVGAAAGYRLGDNKDPRLVPPIVTTKIPVSSGPGLRHLKGSSGPGVHNGVDISVVAGTPVYAVAEGNVIDVAGPGGPAPGWGCYVVIEHAGLPFTTTRYAHLTSVDVAKGPVGKGQKIGLSGGNKGDPCAGKSTGAHLHFSIDESSDPSKYDRFFDQAGKWVGDANAPDYETGDLDDLYGPDYEKGDLD